MRSKGPAWVGLLLVWALTLVLAQSANADEFAARIFTNAVGQTIPYRLLVPKADHTGHDPLVLFFHGAGERGTDNQSQLVHGASLFLKPENRERYPCFVLAPQCPEKQQWVDMPWGADAGERPPTPSTAMQLALETLDAVIKEFKVDTNRIYVTGISMGGYATWDCLTRFPDRFAAAVPVCGGGDEHTVTAQVAKVPVWAFHSDDDTVVKTKRTRNMIQALREAGGKPKYFEYFGLGHNAWDKAYGEPELLTWMFSQRLGQTDTYLLKTKAPELPAVARFPADSEFPAAGPIRNADWFRNVWRERRLSWWNSRPRDQGAVVFLGDSITQGWGTLSSDFPDLKVANRGISGDVTRGVLFRLKEDVLDLHPKAVVLLIGTNDLEDGAEPKLIVANVRAILDRLQSSNPSMPIIVCRVMPSDASKHRPADKIEEINILLDEMVKGDPRLVLCDTWSIFADEQGNAKSNEFPDLLHPNAAGYAKWTQALKPIMAKLNLAR